MSNKGDGMREIEDVKAKINLTVKDELLRGEKDKKDVELVYLEVRPNHAILTPVVVLDRPESSILTLDGSTVNNKSEELVFEVLMLGEQTDDFNLKLEVGDYVLAAYDYIHPVQHSPHSRVLSDEGVNIYGHIKMSCAGITDKVSYKKLTSLQM